MSEAGRLSLDRALRRASLVNALGLAPKLAMPLYLVAISRVLGRDEVGVYLLGIAVQELVSGIAVNGLADATIVHASRALAEGDGHARAARVVAGSLALTGALTALCAVLELAFGEALVGRFFPRYGALHPGLHLLAMSVVPRAFTQLGVASLRAALAPEWDVLLNDVLSPLFLLGGALVVWLTGAHVSALFGVHLALELVMLLVVVRPLARAFGGRVLAAALARPRLDRTVLEFALPQSVSLTLARYLTRLDALLLAHFGLPSAELARFSTAALVTSNLGQIRIVLGRALAPIVARLSGPDDRRDLCAVFDRVTRQAMLVAIPVTLVLVPLREDVLRLVHPGYAGDSRFVLALLAGALVSATLGLGASVLTFTRHVRASLVNGLVAGVLNTVVLAWAIPRYGMLGAAVGTSAVIAVQSAMIHIELRRLARVSLSLRSLGPPAGALGVVVTAMMVLGDPGRFALADRIAVALFAPLAFVLLAAFLGMPELAGIPRLLETVVQAASRRSSSSTNNRS